MERRSPTEARSKPADCGGTWRSRIGVVVPALCLGFAVLPLRALEAQEPPLRRGNHLTEEAAREELDGFAREFDSRASWCERARNIRDGILKGAGLDPLPQRTVLAPIQRRLHCGDGYEVHALAFESLPGYFVTANLYLPDPRPHAAAAILSPHGHFQPTDRGGRFRPDMQLRCASLARMGAVVLAYDMVGWGECTQYPHADKALRFQLWNAIRALDLLAARPEVDSQRIGITGASGGGTQSFLLAAIDERVTASAPAVMVSAHFFGGCLCESGLPIHQSEEHLTNNADIAALMAPRPQLLISCGKDWTRNTPKVEFPYLRRVYSLFDAESQVHNAHFAEEGHDYGPSKRQAAYRFFARYLALDWPDHTDDSASWDESPVTVLEPEALTVFDADHPRPEWALPTAEAIEAKLRQLQ